MATGLHSDGVIRQEYLEAGFIEGYAQNLDAFNAASGGSLVLTDQSKEGYYAQQRFFDALGDSLISRRDLTSTSAATGIKPTMDEVIDVKLFRKAGPVDFTHGMFRTMQLSPEAFSRQLGVRVAQRAIKRQLNDILAAAVAALSGVAAVNHDATDGDFAFTDMNALLGKFGDARQSIAAAVMHSKVFTDLVGDAISNYKIENVAGVSIVQGGLPGLMGRAVIVTDSASLVNSDGITSGTDSYYTLGLVQGAGMVTESESREFVEYYLDRDQITKRIHGEIAYNVGVKGFKWDISNGGANPDDATLATASNWDQVVADKRDVAGVLAESQ